MIPAQTAAEVAARYGLSLNDAAALASLADSAEEADQLAGQFANPQREVPA